MNIGDPYVTIRSKKCRGKTMKKHIPPTKSKAAAEALLPAKSEAKLVYSKPVLTCYGDVRDITLGPTGGFGESGCISTRRPGTPPSCS